MSGDIMHGTIHLAHQQYANRTPRPGQLARGNQPIQRRERFQHSCHARGIILRALFRAVAQSEHLFIRFRKALAAMRSPRTARDHSRDVRIHAGVIAAVHHGARAHRPALGQQLADEFGLVWCDRETNQRRTALDEGPAVVAPGVDPLAGVLERGLLAVGVDHGHRA